MSEEYENLLRRYERITTGNVFSASGMLTQASRAPGDSEPDGGELLQAVAEAENPTVSAEQMYYDSVKTLAEQDQYALLRLSGHGSTSMDEFRHMPSDYIFAIGQAAETAIVRRLRDDNEFNDGPNRFDPDQELEVTLTVSDRRTGEPVIGEDGRVQTRTISLDADELLFLAAVVAEKRLEVVEERQGREAAINLAEEYLSARGGTFAQNTTTQRVLRDMLADENYTSYAEAFRVGALAATEGQLSEITATNDNVVVAPNTPTQSAEPANCIGCN